MESSTPSLERIAAALEKLGVAFCPACGEPHNTLSIRKSDLDGFIHFELTSGADAYLCTGCAPDWLKKNKRKIPARKLGFAIASWILDQQACDADHPAHEEAVALCAIHDVRFDLLLHRRAKASSSRMSLRFWNEEQLLQSVGYDFDLEARQINKSVVEYVDHIRNGGKCHSREWPPVKKVA